MNVRKRFLILTALLALGVAGPATAFASLGEAPHGDHATQEQVEVEGVDEADGNNNDLATQVENENADEGAVDDNSDD